MFVCVSGHVCIVVVGVCVGVCMFVNVCACKLIVLWLYASLAIFVWRMLVFACVYACLWLCVLVCWLCCVCMCIWPCLYGDCLCLPVRMHVCGCACVQCGCVVFVCVSGHVCMVIVRVCVNVCMFVDVCACVVVVLCLYVYLTMFVW